MIPHNNNNALAGADELLYSSPIMLASLWLVIIWGCELFCLCSPFLYMRLAIGSYYVHLISCCQFAMVGYKLSVRFVILMFIVSINEIDPKCYIFYKYLSNVFQHAQKILPNSSQKDTPSFQCESKRL